MLRGLAAELEARGVSVEDVLMRLNASLTLLDLAGRIVWQNDVSIARVGDRRGTSFLRLLASEHRQSAETEFRRAILSGASTRREVVSVGVDGQRMRSISFGVPVRSGLQITGVLAVGVPVNWSEEAPAAPELTPRLRETLDLLTAGRSTREIADELGIAVETARNHIRGLLKRLGVHSRVAAVARARELGLVPDPARPDERD